LVRNSRAIPEWARVHRGHQDELGREGRAAQRWADRHGDCFSLEITFRDCKEVVGAGQQQVRFVWANVGAFHICLWTFTMTEVWAWGRQAEDLVDRSASPWDTAARRPSQADKRRAWRRALMGEKIRAVLRPGAIEAEIQATADRLLSLAA